MYRITSVYLFQVEHILVETLRTGIGQQVTVNKQKLFNNLKDLLDYYHDQHIYSSYKLVRYIYVEEKEI